jgi:hypothetical protein
MRTCGQEVRYGVPNALQKVFGIVNDEEEVPISEELRHPVKQVLARGFRKAESLGERRRDERGIVDGGE